MPNINKVVYGNNTLIDLTGTTATADKIIEGYGAFGRDGAWMDGNAVPEVIGDVYQDENNYVVLDNENGAQIIVNSLSVTQNGTYIASAGHAYSPITVNVPSSGGLEFEEGTVTISSPLSTNYDIQFANTHTKLPSFYLIASTEDGVYASYTVSVMFTLTEDTGVVLDDNSSPSYGMVARQSIGSASYVTPAVTRLTYPSSNLSESDVSHPRYWATESRIRLPASATYRISGTYKWTAIWGL